jgi:hypothetical protein
MFQSDLDGERHDLRDDPGEFVNLWDDPDVLEVKYRSV